MSSRKRSAVWNHFMEVDSKTAKCAYCSNALRISGGNVGNLNRHMKNKHPTVSLEPKRQEMPPVPGAPEPEPIASGSGLQRPPQPLGVLLPPKPTQSSMVEFLQNTKLLGPRRSEKIDEQLKKIKDIIHFHLWKSLNLKSSWQCCALATSCPQEKLYRTVYCPKCSFIY